MDCIFCKIIKNEIPSYTIYEDDLLKVFLDIEPSTNGDLLIVPKKHLVNIMDLNEQIVNHIYETIVKLYPILKEKLDCQGLTIVQNNDYGQEIKHYHVHLTPRYESDGLEHKFNKEQLKPLEDVYNLLTKD